MSWIATVVVFGFSVYYQMEHEQWEEPLSAAMWLAYYALVFWGIQKLFSKMGSWWRGAGKKEEEEEPPIVDVSLEQLGNKKSLSTAYALYFCGGFLSGSHWVYLDCPGYALAHGMTGGFFVLGAFADFFRMPWRVSQHNARMHSRAKADKGVWTMLRGAGIITFLLSIAFIVCIFYLPVLYEFAYSVSLENGVIEPDPYVVLEISRWSSEEDVKKAFKKKSLAFHPDRNPGCGEVCKDKMAEINSAWEKVKKRRNQPKWFTSKDTEGPEGLKTKENEGTDERVEELTKKWSVLLNEFTRWVDTKTANKDDGKKAGKKDKSSGRKKDSSGSSGGRTAAQAARAAAAEAAGAAGRS